MLIPYSQQFLGLCSCLPCLCFFITPYSLQHARGFAAPLLVQTFYVLPWRGLVPATGSAVDLPCLVPCLPPVSVLYTMLLFLPSPCGNMNRTSCEHFLLHAYLPFLLLLPVLLLLLPCFPCAIAFKPSFSACSVCPYLLPACHLIYLFKLYHLLPLHTHTFPYLYILFPILYHHSSFVFPCLVYACIAFTHCMQTVDTAHTPSYLPSWGGR